MTARNVLGGVSSGSKTVMLLDDTSGMDAALAAEHITLEVTDGTMQLTLPELRRFKEAIAHAERVLVSRREQAVLARNLPLPL
jgi:hypothetical protein